MGVHVIESADDFRSRVALAGPKLVVVDFFADWCGPCRTIAPVFQELSNQYPNVVFLKVNVDHHDDVAQIFQVSAMPTFVFLRNAQKIGMVRGANRQALESMLQQHASAAGGPAGSGGFAAALQAAVAGGSGGASAPAAEQAPAEPPTALLPGLLPGHVDLVESIDEQKSECLNEADNHTFSSALHGGGGYLESECDEQLIIFLTFRQPVKIHTLQIQTPDNGHAPKTLRLFINSPNTLDFDSAESNPAAQEIVLKPGDTTGNGLVPLQFVKFQNIQTLTIFVKDNQGGEDTTIIDHFALFGVPVATTNMMEFKRVSGKAGEVHSH